MVANNKTLLLQVEESEVLDKKLKEKPSALIKAFYLALIAVLAGCATTENYENILGTWMGSSADDLVASWGPPQNTYTRSDGGKVLEFKKQSSFQLGGYTYSSPVTTHHSGTMNSNNGGIYGYNGTSTTFEERKTPVQTFNTNCVTRFTVDSSDIIRSWAWEGNACEATAPAIVRETQSMESPTSSRIQQGLSKEEVINIKGRPVSILNKGQGDILWFYSKDTDNGPYVRFLKGVVFTWQN
jgi:hypothetical protein